MFEIKDMTEEQRDDYLTRADKVAQAVWKHVKGQDTGFLHDRFVHGSH